MAASEATKSVMAIRLILLDIGREIKGPTVLFEDNQAAIYFAWNEGTPARMKHINVREYFVRNHVLAGELGRATPSLRLRWDGQRSQRAEEYKGHEAEAAFIDGLLRQGAGAFSRDLWETQRG
jgi:hypothetical protein